MDILTDKLTHFFISLSSMSQLVSPLIAASTLASAPPWLNHLQIFLKSYPQNLIDHLCQLLVLFQPHLP